MEAHVQVHESMIELLYATAQLPAQSVAVLSRLQAIKDRIRDEMEPINKALSSSSAELDGSLLQLSHQYVVLDA